MSVDFHLGRVQNHLVMGPISPKRKNKPQGKFDTSFMYKRSMVQMELLFINICSKSSKKKL